MDVGPTAFWHLNDKDLLFTAGPCVAKMVAGACFGSGHTLLPERSVRLRRAA